MADTHLPQELIDTFEKALEMIDQLARDQGVTIMGNIVIMKRVEGGKFGGYHVRNFTYNHPSNNP